MSKYFRGKSNINVSNVMPFVQRPAQIHRRPTPVNGQSMTRDQQKEVTLQLKVTLKGSKPPIWRRLLVPGDYYLSLLHYLIQEAMGWDDEHLHQFELNGQKFVPDNARSEMALFLGRTEFDEDEYTILDIGLEQGSKFNYWYDFGDNWHHTIEIEKILPERRKHGTCIAGKRACPPEDCGGIWGYYNLLEALKDATHPQHDTALEWLGADFDAAHYSNDGWSGDED